MQNSDTQRSGRNSALVSPTLHLFDDYAVVEIALASPNTGRVGTDRISQPRWREAFNACANYDQLKECRSMPGKATRLHPRSPLGLREVAESNPHFASGFKSIWKNATVEAKSAVI
jgi:hypothetical protein